MKGLFIPEITAEMFRNGCLENIEALMAEGEIYDIDYQQPCSDCISREEVINCVTSNEFRYKIVEDIKTLPSVTPKPKTGHCKDCRWWKDNDGVYRRGVGAESKCPMFEPQESEDKE